MELKKVDKSVVVDKVRREVKPYSFSFWLDAYLKPRRTRCNIPDNISDVSTGWDDEESYDKNVQKRWGFSARIWWSGTSRSNK